MSGPYFSRAELLTRSFAISVLVSLTFVSLVFAAAVVSSRLNKISAVPLGEVSVLSADQQLSGDGVARKPVSEMMTLTTQPVIWTGLAASLPSICGDIKRTSNLAAILQLFREQKAKLLVADDDHYKIANASLNSENCDEVLSAPSSFREIYAVIDVNQLRLFSTLFKEVALVPEGLNGGSSVKVDSLPNFVPTSNIHKNNKFVPSGAQQSPIPWTSPDLDLLASGPMASQEPRSDSGSAPPRNPGISMLGLVENNKADKKAEERPLDQRKAKALRDIIVNSSQAPKPWKGRAVVGERVPPQVNLAVLPDEAERFLRGRANDYFYAFAGDSVILVDREDRKIVEVLSASR